MVAVAPMDSTPRHDDRRDGPSYRMSAAERERFRRDGYVHLAGVLSDDDLDALGATHARFLRREIAAELCATATVAEERRLGFTHSHNDEPRVLERVGFADERTR